MTTPARDPNVPAGSRAVFGGDIRSLHANGSASIAELREYLGNLKGRKPQEVIGIVSASLLVQSLLLAVAATVAILAVFTVGPYLVYGPPKPKQTAAKPGAAQTAANPAPAPAAAASQAETNTKQPDPAKAIKAMGLDETKGADPKVNPLDSPNLDKLIDGSDK